MMQVTEPDDLVKTNFVELIQVLLEDPEERKDFFMVRIYSKIAFLLL